MIRDIQEKRNLLFLYKQYTKQIRLDNKCRDDVARRLTKFAPFKYGDRVTYKSEYSHPSRQQRFGKVVSCYYENGRWEVIVMPTTKAFVEHGSNKGHEFLKPRQVKKYNAKTIKP